MDGLSPPEIQRVKPSIFFPQQREPEALMEETSMTDMVKTMSPVVKNFFSTSAEKLAKETQFVQRTSKMTGPLFLQTFVFGLVEQARASLNDLVEFCADHFGVSITIQGFDDRITPVTLLFMRKMFQLALSVFRQTHRLPVAVLAQFPAINLTDSTGLELPESLADEFPGSGGDASPASLKLHVVLDFLTGNFTGMWLTPGSTPDQKATTHLDLAVPGSLNVFDLGYVVQDHLHTLASKGAYFLCRYFLSTNLYDEAGEKIDLLRLLRAEPRDRFERTLQVGKRVLLPCRVCFFRAPDEVANRRRQKANKLAVKKGKAPSKQALELMGWTILMTNVPASLLSVDQVALFYAVRWQVELLFKLWKSHMNIHRISGYRKERILVELYAKLIGLVVFHFLTMPLRATNMNLSPIKAYKRFVGKSDKLADALCSSRRLQTVISQLHTAILKFARREKRKTRFTTCQQLYWGVDYYA
jgi:hypothetical protein